MFNKSLALLPAVFLAWGASAQEPLLHEHHGGRPVLHLNPDISAILDANFHRYSGDEAPSEIRAELPGFGGHGHEGEHAHSGGHEHGFEEGFNLREVELGLSAEVDPYFKAWAIVGFGEEEAEIEEAVVETTSLPAGLQLKLGKFFSDFSRQNAEHPHAWNFTDAPMVQEVFFGDHGLNEKGVQFSWLAPAPVFLKFGLEILQGDNEKAFAELGEEGLPENSAPRLGVGWVKVAPDLGRRHALQFGAFAARGSHQEEHVHEDEEHFFDGDHTLWGADFVYKHTPPTSHGHGILILEGGYIGREKELEEAGHGEDLVGKQDGLYLQGVYGFAPRWRAGLRAEALGLTNSVEEGDEKESYDPSYRYTAMVDWTLTEFSRLRVQVSRGLYEFEGGREEVTEGFIQAVFMMGAHRTHDAAGCGNPRCGAHP